MTVTERIVELYTLRAGGIYFGEAVTEREHALQSAALAVADHAPETLIVAALLHDIGHLLHHADETVAEQGRDMFHENLGERFLKKHFPPTVTEPVRMHVDAKRYLAAVEPGYQDRLSSASQLSLRLQGGPMNAAQQQAFRASEHLESALQLRRWDDEAKVVGKIVPGVEAYIGMIERCLIRG